MVAGRKKSALAAHQRRTLLRICPRLFPRFFDSHRTSILPPTFPLIVTSFLLSQLVDPDHHPLQYSFLANADNDRISFINGNALREEAFIVLNRVGGDESRKRLMDLTNLKVGRI